MGSTGVICTFKTIWVELLWATQTLGCYYWTPSRDIALWHRMTNEELNAFIARHQQRFDEGEAKQQELGAFQTESKPLDAYGAGDCRFESYRGHFSFDEVESPKKNLQNFSWGGSHLRDRLAGQGTQRALESIAGLRGDPIGLAGRRLDHSAKVSMSCKESLRSKQNCLHFSSQQLPKIGFKTKTTVMIGEWCKKSNSPAQIWIWAPCP